MSRLNARLLCWLRNLPTAHQRVMMRYLRRRGWIVFWLDEHARHCGGVCWLREYLRSEVPDAPDAPQEGGR